MQDRHVLIVEDEAPIRDGLRALFEAQGAHVFSAADGETAMRELDARAHDLVVLDLMIPAPTGHQLLCRARAAGKTVPILVLTARDAEDDIVSAIESGADDYMTKPFGIRELVARAKGLLRRGGSADLAPPVARLGAGAVVVDLVRGEVAHADEDQNPTALTERERRLLSYLAQVHPATASREHLLRDVWGYRDGRVQTRTVDVHVQQLRRRLKNARAPDLIETVRGAGYRLVRTVRVDRE